jgi:hypothetical protein
MMYIYMYSVINTNTSRNTNHKFFFLWERYSLFSQYSIKGLVELDATLVKYDQTKCSNLILPRTFKEIVSYIVESEGDGVTNLTLV